MRFFIFCVFLACGGSPKQASEPTKEPEKPEEEAKPAAKPAAKPNFPADWVGKWHGTIVANAGTNKQREFGMILEINPKTDGRYQWKISYALDDGTNVRDYELVPTNDASLWRIDENNGIVIDAHQYGSTLYTLFDVGGSLIDIRYSRVEDGIEFAVVSSVPAKASKTGGGEVPTVLNLPLAGVQHALLRRVQPQP